MLSRSRSAPVMANRSDYGPATLTFLVIANMIGAGVFTTSGYTIQTLGTPTRVVVAWIAAGLIALCGAISYGRLIRAMPESGGEYVFLARAVHPMAGFVAGWISLIAGFTGAIAFAATALEGYLLPDYARPHWLPSDAIAVSAILAGSVAHGLRKRLGATLQNAAVLLKLGFLTVFLVLAALALGNNRWQGAALADAPAEPIGLLAAFATSLVWISLSYSGFNAAVYVAEEAPDARRDVPRALMRGSIAVIVVYVLLNAVFVFAPPADRIAGQEDIAAITAHWLYGPRLATFIRAIIALALLTSVLSMMMAAPRVYSKMADDGLFPGFMRSTGQTPRRAITVQAALAIAVVLISTLRGLLDYLGLTLSLCAAASAGCLFAPSVRSRPSSVVRSLPVVFYIMATVAAAVIMAADDAWKIVGTLVTCTAGIVVYLIARRLCGHSLRLESAQAPARARNRI